MVNFEQHSTQITSIFKVYVAQMFALERDLIKLSFPRNMRDQKSHSLGVKENLRKKVELGQNV